MRANLASTARTWALHVAMGGLLGLEWGTWFAIVALVDRGTTAFWPAASSTSSCVGNALWILLPHELAFAFGGQRCLPMTISGACTT